MKIALIDPALYTIPYDQALLNGLQAAGHEVTLFGKVAEAGGEQWEIPGLNAHFHRYIRSIREKSVPRAVFLAARGLSHLEGMWRLPTALRRLRPDIIHLQWTPLPAVDAMVLPRLRRIAPLVLTIHDTNYLNGAVSSHLVKLGGDRIHTFFDHLIVHTEDARRKLMARGLGHKDISIVPHGLLHEGELPAPRSRPAAIHARARVQPRPRAAGRSRQHEARAQGTDPAATGNRVACGRSAGLGGRSGFGRSPG
jgi:hypothetical protein